MVHFTRSLLAGKGTSSPPWRILFFGTDRFAISPLKALVENSRASGSIVRQVDVVCPPERRRKKIIKDSQFLDTVRDFSLNHNIPIYYWLGKEGWDADNKPASQYDIGIVASFGHLIPNHVLDMFPCGAINIHPSLLPQWKGASPISQAILTGAKETGVSIVEVSRERFDAGQSLLQQKCMIPEDTMFDDLSEQLARLGTKMLMYTLENLEALRRNPAVLHPKLRASWARRLAKDTGHIDWTRDSWLIIRRKWNALSTRVGVLTSWKGQRVKLTKMSKEFFILTPEEKLSTIPGEVKFDRDRDVILIRCEDSWVGVKQLQFETKTAITARDFFNSYLQTCHVKGSSKTCFEDLPNKER
ncbi:methionyl-tRNA formyltransferase, mitochondrial-like isoform X1 [Acropora muricata]|uniref:methionyl-tRNA formyltransferase, mitochondrial-like n=1 Tax=Acropora millepora TaxID=45264 RepID=UPI001CF54739|nr:methionyl-tRNA formyltransferase, mitochondrial-like [Acropora millepora]